MKRCLGCGVPRIHTEEACPGCGARPARLDGFSAYAPELAYEGTGFNALYFSQLAQLEAGNFWFRARNAIIVWALSKYAPRFQSLLEIGCGTGFVLSELANTFPCAQLTGSEIFVKGLSFAAQRLPTAELMQMDARHIPYVDEFDAVGCFDVLEHIREDEAVLKQIYQALKPGGTMLLTVPQHKWLWSAADDYAHHERRYKASELERKVRQAGFRIVRSTSFVTTLLPAMMVSRAKRHRVNLDYDPTAELRLHPTLNWVFEKLLRIDLAGMRVGFSYPVGGSRLVVAQKP